MRVVAGRGCLRFILLLGAVLAGCKSEKAPSRLVLTGASTVAPLVAEVANRFEERNPGVRVEVQMGGSSRGVADARQGLADIGMISRDLKPEESDLEAHSLARAGVAVFTDRAMSWAELGGGEAPIVVTVSITYGPKVALAGVSLEVASGSTWPRRGALPMTWLSSGCMRGRGAWWRAGRPRESSRPLGAR